MVCRCNLAEVEGDSVASLCLFGCLCTTRETLICGTPIWASVAHPWCATHIKPLIFITSGARLHNIYGAPHLGAPRIGCATGNKYGAPLICFLFIFFSRIQQKYTVYSTKIYSIQQKCKDIHISNTGIHQNTSI
jgi:hypothetical protein